MDDFDENPLSDRKEQAGDKEEARSSFSSSSSSRMEAAFFAFFARIPYLDEKSTFNTEKMAGSIVRDTPGNEDV